MCPSTSPALAEAHRQFEEALPIFRKNFRYWFRRKGRDRDDLFAEALACAWKAWVGLIARGRDPVAVGVTGIANFAARHTLKGRRIANRDGCGRGKMDVQHRRARALGGYRIVSYDSGRPGRAGETPAPWKEWVATDHHMGPADAAAFRIDFSSWLAGLSERRRRTAELLAQGFGTLEVAGLVGVSPAAVSQARPWFEKNWREFQQAEGAPI